MINIFQELWKLRWDEAETVGEDTSKMLSLVALFEEDICSLFFGGEGVSSKRHSFSALFEEDTCSLFFGVAGTSSSKAPMESIFLIYSSLSLTVETIVGWEFESTPEIGYPRDTSWNSTSSCSSASLLSGGARRQGWRS